MRLLKDFVLFAITETLGRFTVLFLVLSSTLIAFGIYGVFFCEAMRDQMGGAAVLAEGVMLMVIMPLMCSGETHAAWKKFRERRQNRNF